jgi:glycosyltransferase involved in cell wall biosynthesis
LPSFYEGTPIALLEAMAMGLPIAAPAVDGIKEVLNGENAFLMTNPNNDTIHLTKLDLHFAYDLFSSENAIIKNFKKTMLQEREKYTEDIFAKNLINVIDNIITH